MLAAVLSREGLAGSPKPLRIGKDDDKSKEDEDVLAPGREDARRRMGGGVHDVSYLIIIT